ncbi:MAG TPA: carboxypeptidase-like regulatory domain-containing protein [Candidatus Thermoplasmatota archaeon]|nr:carboxypeptidase-like regulatory domain-containing protein [Candidatus Thermoplasmatota archaeon]
MRGFWIVLVASALLVSGCASSKPKDAEPTTTEDEDGLPEGINNVLLGTVVGPDSIPIGNATVEVLSVGMKSNTTEVGEYEFTNLEPRDYLIAVTKEGYRTKTQRAIVEDGKVFELNFQLEERPLDVAYNETLPFSGFIACQVAYATNPENVQYQDCGAADPNNKVVKEYEINPGGAQVIIEAEWVANQALAERLTMAVESVGFGHQDLVFGQISGPSGLRMPIEEQVMRKYYPEGGKIRVSFSAAPNLDNDYLDVGLAFQQNYKLYASVFYIDPGPPGYSYLKR